MTFSVLKYMFFSLLPLKKRNFGKNVQLCYNENPQEAICPKETKASWEMAGPRSKIGN